jgi:cytochrome b561
MNLIQVVIAGFILLEASNVLALYFFPDSKLANSVGVFKAWERSKQDPELHNFVRYLVNWVAGTKLIFILLLVVMLFRADQETLVLAGIALIISISSFFWRLFPLIRRMDREGEIEPKNYSAVLGWMILALILVFLTAVLFSYGGQP